MKRHRARFEYDEEMREDCERLFRDAVAESPSYYTTADIAAVAVQKPAARYWVSERQAYRVVCGIVRDGFSVISKMSYNKYRMYYDLYNAVMKRRRKGESLKEATFRICGEAAPEMYLTPMTLMTKLSQWRRARRRH